MKKNVLAIGAHFDDVEFGCGGTIAKHVKNGDAVTIAVVTESAHMYEEVTVRSKDKALEEGRNAAKVLGVEGLVHLDLKNEDLSYARDLIIRLEQVMKDRKIDTVYTHWIYDTHQDHSTIGQVSLTSARRVPRVLMYRSNWYASPHDFRGNFFVDISEMVDQKIAAIRAHETECRRYGPEWIDYIIGVNATHGIPLKVKHAEVFEVVRFLE